MKARALERCVGSRAVRPRAAAATLLAAAVLVVGCANLPPPLPAVSPAELPEAWLEAITAQPPPPPFESRLRIRVRIPEQPAGSLDGILRMACPDTVSLSARLGAFRPVFALAADRDSAALWLHEAARYGVGPRSAPDWERLDPAAWATALIWLIHPADLLRRLVPDGPGWLEEGIWAVGGALRDTPLRAALRIDTRTRTLAGVQIERSDEPILVLEAARPRSWNGFWLAERFELRSPRDGLSLQITRLGIGSWHDGERRMPRRGRPVGWSGVNPGDSILSAD